MTFRLKTSVATQNIFKLFEKRDHLQPYILAKIAIALAIRSSTKVIPNNEDTNGLDLNRQTILGEYDNLFKTLIEIKEGKHISDSEYFPMYVKSYLDAGAKLLEQEYKYSNDFFIHLVQLDKGI